jgi:ABC-type metal ion transport system substrate-binding protein
MKKFRCKYCGREFKTEYGLAEHLCRKDDDITREELESLEKWNIIIVKNKKELNELIQKLKGENESFEIKEWCGIE